MKTICRALIIVAGVSLVATLGQAAPLPTLHMIEQHQCAMLVVPSSHHPVTIQVTNSQQQVFLRLSLDAARGTERRLNFSHMPSGHYLVEVQFDHRTLYKVVRVDEDRVTLFDTFAEFKTTENFQL